MKRSVLALLIFSSFAVSAHGHNGGNHGNHGNHMGGHSFGGHSFSGHDLNGRMAGRINNGHTFNGFARGSINMGDTPAGDFTHSTTVNGGVVTHKVGYKTDAYNYDATTTISKNGVTRESAVQKDGVAKVASTVISADMRSHTVAVTNGDVSHVSIRSYAQDIGGLNIHGTKAGNTTVATMNAYNNVANEAISNHMLKSGDMTRVGSTVVAPDMRTHMVVAADDTGMNAHIQGYVGNEQAGVGFNKHIAKQGDYGFERSVNTLGIATIGTYGPNHYAEKVANLKTGQVKTITDITPPAPAPTPVVIHVVPLTPLTPAVPQPTPVVVHVVPEKPITPPTPAHPVVPANATFTYVNTDNDYVAFWWNV